MNVLCRYLAKRADALFELADALLCADRPVKTLVGLSLAPEHLRRHGDQPGAAVLPRLRAGVGQAQMIPGWPPPWSPAAPHRVLYFPAPRSHWAAPPWMGGASRRVVSGSRRRNPGRTMHGCLAS